MDDILSAGDSLGYGAKDFEGYYFGSFYDPAVGLLSEPMPLPGGSASPAEPASSQEPSGDFGGIG